VRPDRQDNLATGLTELGSDLCARSRSADYEDAAVRQLIRVAVPVGVDLPDGWIETGGMVRYVGTCAAAAGREPGVSGSDDDRVDLLQPVLVSARRGGPLVAWRPRRLVSRP